MKTKLILDVYKTEYAQLNYFVNGRVGDMASNSVDVYIVDGGGNPYSLTNLTIFYECTKPDNTVIRDSTGVKMIDAANGHFEYTFPKETFSTPGRSKRSFFAIEKDKVIRATTQDFIVVSLPNALDGNIQSAQYISDLEKLIADGNQMLSRLNSQTTAMQTKINDLNKQISTMDVVKKTGDTMTGTLTAPNFLVGKTPVALSDVAQMMKITTDVGGVTISVSDTTKNILDEIVAKGLGMNTIYAKGGVQGSIPSELSWRGFSHINSTGYGYVFAKDYQNKLWTNYNDNGKWLGWVEHADASKVINKLGDTMTGPLKFTGNNSIIDGNSSTIIQGGGNSTNRWRVYQSGGGEFSFAPSITAGGEDWDYTKVFRIKPDGTIRQVSDIDWTNLTLVNGATVDAGNTPRYTRKGNVVYIVGAVTNVTDSMTIANLPVALRPSSNCTFAVTYLSTDTKKYIGEVNVRTDGKITLDWMWNQLKSTSFCISYHL